MEQRCGEGIGRYTPVKLVHVFGDGDWVPLADPIDDLIMAKRVAMVYAARNKRHLRAGVMDESFIVYEVASDGWRYLDGVHLEASVA